MEEVKNHNSDPEILSEHMASANPTKKCRTGNTDEKSLFRVEVEFLTST